MADEKQLRILWDKGVKAWNLWRQEHPDVRIELSEAAFIHLDLTVVHLSGADLSGANLSRAFFKQADLSGADLSSAYLKQADLSGADLRGANLRGADLSEARFSGADLSGADLGRTDLYLTDLSKADLRGANLARADLDLTNLSEADLSEVNLLGTYLNRVSLSGTNFGEARVGFTVFSGVDLGTAKGLESMVHGGASTIGIDTVYHSRGRIPEAFLRGAGVPEEFITYMRSLVGRTIEYYSCFISYSSKDQAFAERLHADLQAKGVRCWFAPEDMKIGDKIWDRLDQSIRLHDKLLVILSSNSIGSEWVEDEVTTAFEEERKRGKTVLFPVRLDDAVMETGEAWAAKVRQRHIGDFRAWKEHDAYRVAFERLVRDLKAGAADESG